MKPHVPKTSKKIRWLRLWNAFFSFVLARFFKRALVCVLASEPVAPGIEAQKSVRKHYIEIIGEWPIRSVWVRRKKGTHVVCSETVLVLFLFCFFAVLLDGRDNQLERNRDRLYVIKIH